MLEQTQVSLGGPGKAGHPDLEELAALADGRCRSADAARVRAHLASCKDCYEVFLETVQLLEEKAAAVLPGEPFGEVKIGDAPPVEKKGEPRRVLPFPFNEDMKPHYRWAAASVAALLVLGVGGALWRTSRTGPNLSVATLATAVGKVADVGTAVWAPSTKRGPGEHQDLPTDSQAFQLGAELFNLQLALKLGDESAGNATARVYGLLESLTVRDLEAEKFYTQLRVDLDKKQPAQSLAPKAAQEAERLRNSGISDVFLDFGAWAEAGRLAASAQRPAFFQRQDAGYLLAKLQREQDADLPDGVVKDMKAIEAAGGKDKLSGDDYQVLKGAFEQILGHYYQQGRPSS